MNSDTPGNASERTLNVALGICITLLLAMSLHLALYQKINWDEFYFLSRIYTYERGELVQAFQNFHVHLFGWLTQSGFDTIESIQAGRIVMWLCQVVTAWMIFLVARVFLSVRAALFSVLCYLSMAYVLIHGTSFRTDPLAAVLMMVGLALALRSQLRAVEIIAMACLFTVAALTTVKVVFFLPVYIAALVWRAIHTDRLVDLLLRAAVTLVLTIAVFLLVNHWHNGVFPEQLKSSLKSSVSSSTNTVFREVPWFPQLRYMISNALMTPWPVFALMAGGLVAVQIALFRRGERLKAIALIALATPVLSFAIYRNAFPYYFPFILPPAMMLTGLFFSILPSNLLLRAAVTLVIFCSAIPVWMGRENHSLENQRTITQAIHQTFVEPVAYFDHGHAIPSFPQKGFFMSTMGMAWYESKDRPLLRDALQTEPVPLLFLNSLRLEDAVGLKVKSALRTELSKADKDALRNSYIPHWGPIWVAGKSLPATATTSPFEVMIPGSYRVDAVQPFQINGQLRNPGDVVLLERGLHQIQSTEPQTVELRWAEAKPVRDLDAPRQHFFTAFQ